MARCVAASRVRYDVVSRATRLKRRSVSQTQVTDRLIDYASCTLAELRDVAAHIDRERFAERATEVDREISRRQALPVDLREPVSFTGGLRAGISLYFEKTASWPLIELSFSTAALTIRASPLALMSSFTFTREEVPSIQEHRPWFVRGFQIVHTRRDYPPVVLFLALNPDPIRNALIERRWSVRPANETQPSAWFNWFS